MDIDWSILLSVIIIICATIGLVAGKLDAKDFITCIGLVLSFLSGQAIERYRLGRRLSKNE